jgi:hypothetical protein
MPLASTYDENAVQFDVVFFRTAQTGHEDWSPDSLHLVGNEESLFQR